MDFRSGGAVAEVDWTKVTWRKSRRSGSNGGCLEVAFTGEVVGVRDSKNPAGAMLMFDADAWIGFIAALKRGEFDLPSELQA
jgi:hypothetical protein